MTRSRRKDERVHKNAIFNRLSTGVSSAFKRKDERGTTMETSPFAGSTVDRGLRETVT